MVSEKQAIAPGWRLDDEGRLIRETIHRMTRRLVGWDYRAPSIYQITIVLADRRTKALGRLVVGEKDDQSDAKVELSPLGEAVAGCWESIARFYPQIQILAKRVMPDHFHGILWVKEPLSCHLGQVIKGFKTGCNKAARELGVSFSTTMSSSAKHPAGGLFAPGFQDTILFREGQLKNMFRYLADNPRRLAIKKLSPDLFKTVSSLRVALPGLSPTASGHFAALGNRFLLNRPLAQVQVSRRFFGYKRVPKPGGGFKIARDEKGEPIVEFSSSEFEARRTELFAAAKHGAVLLSPCVSDGERQIAREALSSGYPLITMQNKGFSPIEKPSGRYFGACAEGRLLMLAPIAWPYQPGEKPMTRFDATAMNRLCQLIAGEDAVEINYHGMKPANIDALAIAAANASAGFLV